MKRLVVLTLAAMLTFAMAAPAGALEVTVKGDMHFAFILQDKASENLAKTEFDTFAARSRVRTTIEFIASENIKGVLSLHTLNSEWWGEAGKFNQLDGNKNSLYIREAYIDWNLQNAPLNLKVGLQNFSIPNAVAGPVIFNTRSAGVVGTFKANDNVGLTLGWLRPYSGGGTAHNSVDMFALVVPVQFGGVKITPFADFMMIGRDTTLIYGSATDHEWQDISTEDNAELWHAGLAFDANVTDAFNLKADFNYGALRTSGDDDEAAGWFADIKAAYDIGLGKIALSAWYASGMDKDDYDETDDRLDGGFMPTMHYSGEGTSGWMMSSLGFWGNPALTGGGNFHMTPAGTWGAKLSWENFSFVTDLSHTLNLLYYEGTSDKYYAGEKAPIFFDAPGKWIMTENDSAYEVNFDSTYQIYKNLQAVLAAGVVYTDWGKDTRDLGNASPAPTMWRVALGLYYNF